jgi:hypothetical protein
MSKSFAALTAVMLGAKAGDVKHNFEIRIRKSKGVNKCPTDSGNWDNSRNQANSYPVHPRQDRFDRSDPRSFPPPEVDVLVETERGQTYPARFIQKSTDFSLQYALWGNQGG